MTWICLAHRWKWAGCEMGGGGSRQVSIDVTVTFDNLLMIWSGWKQSIYHWSGQSLATRWCNCSLLLNHPEPAQRRKNHFVTVGSFLASAFPWLQPLQLSVGVGQTPSLKCQACIHWWPQNSGGRYQCSDTGQIHLRNSSNRCKAFLPADGTILSTYRHPCRLGISQYYGDFYTASEAVFTL